MKLILNILIFLFATLHAASIYAVTPDIKTEKELLIRLGKIENNDTMRLNILFRLSEITPTLKERSHYINLLLKEAEIQDNNKYRCYAYLSLIKFAYNNFDIEEVNRLMNIMEPLALKEKNYDIYFQGKRCAIDILMLKGEYELEEKEARKMLKKAQELNNPIGIALASQCLSNIYLHLYKAKEAAIILEENFPVTMEAGNGIHFEVGNSLIGVYRQLRDYENWLKWLKIQERNISYYIKESPENINDVNLWYLMTYIYYIDYYTMTGNFSQAEKYLNLAEKYHTTENYQSVNNLYFDIRWRYFYATDQYEIALNEINNCISLYETVSHKQYNANLFSKARILIKLNKFDEALQIYKKAFSMKDSLEMENFNTQTKQLKKDYKTDLLLLEGEKISRKRQLSVTILFIIIIIILICFNIHSHRINRRLKKSEQEMQIMTADMELANIAKEKFLSNISSVISIPLNEVVAGSIRLSSDNDIDIEERRQLSEQIKKTSAMLMKLINNILDLSRLEAGMMKYNISDTEIVSLINYTINNIKATHNTAIEFSLPEEQIIKSIDNKRLQEIITNLLIPIDENPVNFKMKSITENGVTKVFIYVYNSLLATKEKTQEIIVVNEINRMLVEHFNGRYEIHSEEPVPYIEFTL